jgi:transcriptional regulator with XRE-family HTH domain
VIDLRQRRKELGLTMKQVADAVGVSEATISRYESGNIRNMRRDRIDKYAKVLRVNLLDMIEFEDQVDELNKAFAKDYEVLMGYLRERFDNADEVNAAYELIIRLPMLNEAGINRMIERFDELSRFDEYKSAALLESESTSN